MTAATDPDRSPAPRRVGFLGPVGTFTEQAMLREPDLAELEAVPYPLMTDVLFAVAEGEVDLGAAAVGPGALAYLGSGRDELGLAMGDDARVILLGGTPFESEILMWWNFVARTPKEIADARADWEAHRRFGEVFASPEAIEAIEKGYH